MQNINIIAGGYPCGVTYLGGPPQGPWGPPGVLGCHRALEKIAKIPKNYMKILHASKHLKL